MKDYASKYNLTERPANEIVDVSQLSEQVKEGRNQLAILDGQISTDEAMIENLNDRYPFRPDGVGFQILIFVYAVV